jgi:hypothetical protein
LESTGGGWNKSFEFSCNSFECHFIGWAHPLFASPGAKLGIDRSGLVVLQVIQDFVSIGFCTNISGAAGASVVDWQVAKAHVPINTARTVSRIALPPPNLCNAHVKKYTSPIDSILAIWRA